MQRCGDRVRCLHHDPHSQGTSASYAPRTSVASRKAKYDLCSTPTADYVTCSVDRGEGSVTGVATSTTRAQPRRARTAKDGDARRNCVTSSVLAYYLRIL